MRIGIAAQVGIGNIGDEGILLAIMDSLGREHEYILSTSLPFTMTEEYQHRIPNVTEVRTLDDTRVDYDVCLYGGGKIDWGFGWGYFIRAFAEQIPTMAYGIGLRTDQTLKHSRLYPLYKQFLKRFDGITVRDMDSMSMLKNIVVNTMMSGAYVATGITGLSAETTMCPAINLKEEKTACINQAIVACPRYGDYDEKGNVDNSAQINWFVEQLKPYEKDLIELIPFYPKDLEGAKRDLELCQEINKRLGGGCNIFPSDGFNARKVKYAISKSARVLSGGRYHAIVWAIAHGIPYKIAPTIAEPAFSKLSGLVNMDRYYGVLKLKEMERGNYSMFTELKRGNYSMFTELTR